MNYSSKKIIVLVGIMGCGKTSIGLQLSKQLDIDFFDTDRIIEKRENMKITKIFDQKGEDYFRKIEKEIINELVSLDNLSVISLGGGAFNNEMTRKILKKNTLSIWLDVKADTILKRISKSSNRPLISKTENKKEKILQLINEREKFYKEADIRIKGDNKSKKTITNEILKEMQLLFKSS